MTDWKLSQNNATWTLVGVLISNAVFLWFNLFMVRPELSARLLSFAQQYEIDSTGYALRVNTGRHAPLKYLVYSSQMTSGDEESALIDLMSRFPTVTAGIRYVDIDGLRQQCLALDSGLTVGGCTAFDTLPDEALRRLKTDVREFIELLSSEKQRMADSIENSRVLEAKVVMANTGRAGESLWPMALLILQHGRESISIPLRIDSTDFSSHSSRTMTLKSNRIVVSQTSGVYFDKDVALGLELLTAGNETTTARITFMTIAGEKVFSDSRNLSLNLPDYIREQLKRDSR